MNPNKISALIFSGMFTWTGKGEKTASTSIASRLNSILRVSTGIMLVSFTLFIGYTATSKYHDTIQRMRSLVSILVINSEAPLVFSDRSSAEENLRSLSAINEVTTAGIVKANGESLATYTSATHLVQKLPNTAQKLVRRFFTSQLRLEQPVLAPVQHDQPMSESKHQVIGQVWIEADLAGYWLELATVLSIFIPVMLAIYGLGRTLNNRLAAKVVKPLEELAQTALEIAQNRKYDTRLLLRPGITELNAVMKAFNQMLEQIQARDEELLYRRDQLEQYNEELKDFSYIVSHDLRAPMINVQGFVNELGLSLNDLRKIMDTGLDQLPDHQRKALLEILDEDIPTSTRFITGGVAKMNQLLAAILKISRVGRQELNISVVDTQRVVNDNIGAIKYQSDQAGAEFQIQDLPQVTADPYLLSQIFANLLSNAVKYLDPARPGKIEIWAEDHDDYIKFFVRDNGLGISETDQRKIFDMFRRGGNHAVEGEGVGLNYVKSAVKRLGGNIAVESTVSEGSLFSFTLPKIQVST